MTAQHHDTCAGCTHARRRLRWSKPRIWCARFGKLHETGCIDYQSKRTAIAKALDYYQRSSLK